MNKDRVMELMARKLSGEATPEELRELQDHLSADPAVRDRSKVLDQFWSRGDDETHTSVEENLRKVLTGLGLPGPDVAEVVPMGRKRTWWKAASGVVPLKRKRAGLKAAVGVIPMKRKRTGLKAAAAVLILIGAGTAVYLGRSRQTEAVPMASLMEKHNAKGTKSIIQLPDGSKIWLNADSKLRYPEVFKGRTREIYLNGEAFFDVARNPDHPFIIHLANGTVQVLGTSFNIRAYDNESVVETSVTTGRIAFIPKYKTPRKRQDTVFLAPDHKASYTFASEELSTSVTSGKEDKAWTEGKLIFRAMTMEQIAIELERNFGKKVVFLDEGPKAFVFTGSFENNSLDEIMYYLTRTKSFSYKITNSELLIAADARQLR